MVIYEERLANDSKWALSEGSRYFEEKSALQHALRKIARLLNELHIPYAVAGGMALFTHGLRRFTEDVDILVTREGLKTIHEKLKGLGYIPVFAGSKSLRDAELGVRIEFVVTGQYPGDGKRKPVAFPDPANVVFERDGINYLNLATLIELKLASGMTNTDRMKDLADVQELIKFLNLPSDFAEQLNPYVRGKYGELWQAVRQLPKRYVRLWRSDVPIGRAKTLDDIIANAKEGAEILAAMRDDGVILDPDASAARSSLYLVTTDPDVARKYDMHEESELWDDGDGDPTRRE